MVQFGRVTRLFGESFSHLCVYLSVDRSAELAMGVCENDAHELDASLLVGDALDESLAPANASGLDTSAMNETGDSMDMLDDSALDLTPIKRPSSRARASPASTTAATATASTAAASSGATALDGGDVCDDFVRSPGAAVDRDNDAALEAAESTALHLALVFFDCREFARVAGALANCRSLRALYVKHYAAYLLGEKRKEEQMHDMAEPVSFVVVDHALSPLL